MSNTRRHNTPTPSYRLEPVVVSHDVDRFLLNTEAAFRTVVEATAQSTPLTAEEVMAAYKEQSRLRKLGKISTGFNVVGYLEGELERRHPSYSWDDDILPAFVALGSTRDLLMPGAEEYVDALAREGVYQGLLTYGSWSVELEDEGNEKERSAKWQLGKIAASPLLASLPAHVLTHPHKMRYWAQERSTEIDGVLSLAEHRTWDEMLSGLNFPGDNTRGILLPHGLSDNEGRQALARYVIQGDDKPEAFGDSDETLTSGVHVLPMGTENRMSYQTSTGELPRGTIQVVGLERAREAVLAKIRHIRGQSEGNIDF